MPGNLLGSRKSCDSKSRTTASHPHIRIALKDDNLGLGAKRDNHGENTRSTGLDTFQDLLGRLNGKAEVELQKEQIVRAHLQCSAFVDQRWGRLHFVSGGLLVGDELQKSSQTQPVLNTLDERRPNSSKDLSEESRSNNGLSRNSPEIKRGNTLLHSNNQDTEVDGKHNSSDTVSLGLLPTLRERSTATPSDSTIHTNCGAEIAEKARRRAEKAERKRKRQSRREARNASRSEAYGMASTPSSELRDPQTPDLGGNMAESHNRIQSSRPSKGSVIEEGGRHAVRQRYIRQKKLAMMDRKALDEVGQ